MILTRALTPVGRLFGLGIGVVRLAFAPPFQLREYIEHYKGVYDEGPDVLREKRLQRMKDLGLCPENVEPHPVVADEVKEWAKLTASEKAKSCKAMEVFAAMVECIDHNVGKVVDYLEATMRDSHVRVDLHLV